MRTVLLLGCIFIHISTSAFRFTDDFNLGIYWGNLPIKITKIASSQFEGRQLDDVVRRAQRKWEDVAGLEIWDDQDASLVGSALVRNTIRWSDDFGAETGFSPVTTLAVTVRHRRGTFFEYFEIILNGENPNLRNNAGDMLYEVMLHELGHVVGIGHSERTPAVMEPSLVGYQNLQSDDEQAIVAVMNETLNRQSTGFVSALATSESDESNAIACGSVSMGSGTGGSGGNLQVLLGFIIASLALFKSGRQKVPVYS